MRARPEANRRARSLTRIESDNAPRAVVAVGSALKLQELEQEDHGKYSEVTAEKEFLRITTTAPFVVAHFVHEEFRRCKIMDAHLRVRRAGGGGAGTRACQRAIATLTCVTAGPSPRVSGNGASS